MSLLRKLEQLPRPQRLRKIWKIFSGAEQRLCRAAAASGLSAGGVPPVEAAPSAALPAAEAACLAELLGALTRDEGFSDAARRALAEARTVIAGNTEPGLRRALNGVRHLLLAETGRSPADWDFLDDRGRLDPAGRRLFAGMRVYLEDIRSPFNVGAMFRTAESFGAEKIFLSPLCADPSHPRAKRSAMGCTELLPWERLREDPFNGDAENSAETAEKVPRPALSPDTPVFALETGGVPLAEFPFPSQGLLVVGSEELGVSPRALAAADASLGRLSIPIYGAKGSLNASVAFGIAMQAWAAALKRSLLYEEV
ncbi:MAG: TrmH family RNA methyltransferase [Treponema sp.]|jgi:TrmH family RNA methyltransferase|nr:TrmH family RNA methyltransferase [Treponema sp.]